MDVQALEAELAALAAAETPETMAAPVAAMRALRHEMRGMGGTFGFPLISRFADRLHRIISESAPIDPTKLATIALHVQTLRAIAAHRVSDDGGVVAGQLVGGVEAAVAGLAPSLRLDWAHPGQTCDNRFRSHDFLSPNRELQYE